MFGLENNVDCISTKNIKLRLTDMKTKPNWPCRFWQRRSRPMAPPSTGAVVAERLYGSPPTKANRVQSSAGPLPDLYTVGIVPEDASGHGFSRGSPVSPPLHSNAAQLHVFSTHNYFTSFLRLLGASLQQVHRYQPDHQVPQQAKANLDQQIGQQARFPFPAVSEVVRLQMARWIYHIWSLRILMSGIVLNFHDGQLRNNKTEARAQPVRAGRRRIPKRVRRRRGRKGRAPARRESRLCSVRRGRVVLAAPLAGQPIPAIHAIEEHAFPQHFQLLPKIVDKAACRLLAGRRRGNGSAGSGGVCVREKENYHRFNNDRCGTINFSGVRKKGNLGQEGQGNMRIDTMFTSAGIELQLLRNKEVLPKWFLVFLFLLSPPSARASLSPCSLVPFVARSVLADCNCLPYNETRIVCSAVKRRVMYAVNVRKKTDNNITCSPTTAWHMLPTATRTVSSRLVVYNVMLYPSPVLRNAPSSPFEKASPRKAILEPLELFAGLAEDQRTWPLHPTPSQAHLTPIPTSIP
ncbi:hypothetical protein PR048_021334 [Dryococelus australis]|uniref:Uncharacterized protein n=1 Tax=Dryococelus australis TaxID=614101 RepID=A0ABQ9GXW3_9NEOP|nr:hypothetical protein PR048_021334 [Dryococelus australis]